MISRVLTKTGATVRDCGMMFNSVAQALLLYSSESWVVAGYMVKFLKLFHHRAARWITVMTEKRVADGEC